MSGCSSGGGRSAASRWFAGCKVTFLVHGHKPAMKQLTSELRGTHKGMPALYETFEL